MGDGSEKLHIAVLGDSMLDEYRQGEWDAQRQVYRPMSLVTVPGGAGNVACNVRALGATPLLFSVVGRSQLSAKYRRCLRSAGISQDYIRSSRAKEISHKSNLMAGEQRLLRMDRDDNSILTRSDEEALLSNLLESGTMWSDLILSDYRKGCVTSECFDRVRSFCAQRRIRLYVDSASAWTFGRVFFYKPNRYQLEQVIGKRFENRDQLSSAALRFKRRYQITHMAVTMDREGLIYLDEHDRICHIESSCREAVDPCGAGDTWIAALAVAVASGHPVARAVRLANEAASVACNHIGTYAVSANEVPGWND